MRSDAIASFVAWPKDYNKRYLAVVRYLLFMISSRIVYAYSSRIKQCLHVCALCGHRSFNVSTVSFVSYYIRY